MAVTQNTYTGDGSTVLFSFTFPYLETTDVKVSVDGTVTTEYTLANATTVQFNTAPANGAAIRIYRQTDDSDLSATFYPGSAIRSQDLNDNFTQNLYVTQEVNNTAVRTDGSNTMVGDLDMGGYEVINVGTPTSDGAAVNKQYVDSRLGDLDIPGFTRWTYNAVGGETDLSGAGSTGGTLAYSAGREQVFLNGAQQQRGVDYTADDGINIEFAIALTAGDVVEVICVNNLNTGTTAQAQDVSFVQAGSGAITRSVQNKLRDVVSVKDFGAVGDGVTDDTAAIQAAIDATAGKTLMFDAVTYRTTATLTISSSGTRLLCGGAIIDYYGTAAAIGFGLVSGTNYPTEVEIHNLTIHVNNGPSSSGLLVRTSYSRYYNVGVLLKSGVVSAKGFVLVGDEANGTGPYYNLFQGCSVQSQSGGTDHIGVLFTTQAPIHRGPNANTWVGGRVGQCATGFRVVGNGNGFINPTVENSPATGTAFDFVSPVASACTQNNVVSAYIENASTAFNFGSDTINNSLFNPYVTGVSTFVTDAGTDNLYVTGNAATKLPTGVQFGTLSSDANVLDYYEEGTWTPTLVGGTSAGSYTLTSSTAKYTRIGRMVHVSAYATITVNSAGSGTARFGGLPYAKAPASTFTGAASLTNFSLPASNSGINVSPWSAVSSDSTFYLEVNRTGTSPYGVTCSDINSSASISISFTYFV